MDGVNPASKFPSELGSLRSSDAKKLPKPAEVYVAIENRLAAQREKPNPGPQLNSIFDQLRGRLPK